MYLGKSVFQDRAGNYCRRQCGNQETGCASFNCMCSVKGFGASVREHGFGRYAPNVEEHKARCQNDVCAGQFDVPTCVGGVSEIHPPVCADASGKGLGCMCPQSTPACNLHSGYW